MTTSSNGGTPPVPTSVAISGVITPPLHLSDSDIHVPEKRWRVSSNKGETKIHRAISWSFQNGEKILNISYNQH